MKSSRSNLALSAALLGSLFVSGCAFTDGDPWGQAEFRVSAAFDPPASRLENGALKTARNYRLVIDELSVEVETVELEVSTSGESASFDPADPPEGYSLCHNGHCHSDSGELVDYEDIEVELGGGDYVATQIVEQTVPLDVSSTAVAAGDCANDCALPRGGLGNVRLSIHEVSIVATVSDAAETFEPYAIDLTVPVDAELVTPVDGIVGRGEPGIVELDVRFDPGAELFDRVDFTTDVPSDGTPNFNQLSEVLRGALESNATLDVEVERRSFNQE